MASNITNIDIGNPMHLVTLTVTLPKEMKLRMWVAGGLMRMAARVIGCGIKVGTEAAEPVKPPRRRPF